MLMVLDETKETYLEDRPNWRTAQHKRT